MKAERKKIHCLDLSHQHQQLKRELFEAFEKVYDQTAFSGGPFVASFEKDFASFTHTKYCAGVSNGTTALHLAMLALGIGAGDEVIVPANTFIASAWGVSHAGAKPVFVDCHPHTWEIDASTIEAAITPRTKAILGVHLYGQPFDVDAVKEICNRYRLFLIEDAAQAQGARYKSMVTGGLSDIACFSFYPGKNLGACGEAGGITTNSEELYNHILSLRNHGSVQKYYHDEIGYNYRMGGLEAASLSIKLQYLDAWNNKRKAIAKTYQSQITNPLVKKQEIPEWADGVYHLFVVTVQKKEAFVSELIKNDIIPAYHYPVPCHLQKAYLHLGYNKGDFPNSEYLAEHCISLPMYPELTEEEVQRVINCVNNFNG